MPLAQSVAALSAITRCSKALGLATVSPLPSSVMRPAASTLAVPLQQLVLCLPFIVGRWAESFFVGDAVALVVVLAGFAVYQFLAREGRAARRAPRQAIISEGLLADGRETVG